MSKSIKHAAVAIAIFSLLLSEAGWLAAQMTPGSGASAVGNNAYQPPAPPDASLQAPATSGTPDGL